MHPATRCFSSSPAALRSDDLPCSCQPPNRGSANPSRQPGREPRRLVGPSLARALERPDCGQRRQDRLTGQVQQVAESPVWHPDRLALAALERVNPERAVPGRGNPEQAVRARASPELPARTLAIRDPARETQEQIRRAATRD